MSQRPHVYRRPAPDPAVRTSLSVLAAFVQPRSRVLDLGTGAGGLGAYLRETKACTVDGLTLSAEEAEVARPDYRRVVVGNLESEDWPTHFDGHGYDVIVCADVLEHVREPAAVLAQCTHLLAPGGLLLASVPNVAYAGLIVSLMHGEWTYGPEGLLDASHLRFFTRQSFEELLNRQGWTLHAAEPIEQPWFETEFARRWDHLPPAVADHLLALPHASVYQWVFAAARQSGDIEAVRQAAKGLPASQSPSVSSYVMQLFVDRGQGYSDATKQQQLGRMGLQAQTLRFELAAGQAPVRGLRLDPADRPGFWLLRALRLRAGTGEVVWQWLAQQGAGATFSAADCHQVQWARFDPGRQAVPVRMTGDDPQLPLPVPQTVWDQCAGRALVLEVVCDWPWSADYQAAVQAQTLPPLQQASAGAADAAGWAPFEPAPATSLSPSLSTDAPPWWQRLRPGRRGLPDPNPPPARPAALAGDNKVLDEVVEIIVPVYGNRALVERCLRSVMATTCATRWHVTVLDDASPDTETRDWLRQWGLAHPGATVLAAARNAGFVHTVNLGMQLAGRRDVVLLNSDAEVAGDWLYRLRAAAHALPRVATVTPFSNNATICSLPRFCEDNPLPAGHTTASVHDLVSRLCTGRVVEVPTAVGFCMYISRACLDEVGLFDADTFGLGYGEENDFCMRATAAGWRHLHALDAFVFHQGGASFSERRHALQQNALKALLRLHPDYEDRVRAFVAADPARADRERVVQALGPTQNGLDQQFSA